MTEFLDNLLKKRGLEKKKEIETFLNPKWEDNYDPFLFLDMKKIAKRIWQAIEKNENILIFSDYDTDGIPGGVILAEFFKKIGYKNFENLIPNRNSDGYGLSEKMVKKIISGNFLNRSDLPKKREKFIPDLVITVDCGITDVVSAEILKKEKIDLIITDHHLPGDKLPKAFGILDHKIKGEKYPEQILSGSGIAFKLVQALISYPARFNLAKFKKKEDYLKLKNLNLKINHGWEKWLLDLVAVATVCDMVPLVGENRLLVKYGQIVLNKTRRPGLKRIIEKARLNKNKITTGDIGFMIGPRINAAARLEDPIIAFNALDGNEELAIFSAEELERINNRRKYLIAKIMKQVWKKLEKHPKDLVVVIGDRDWPLGVLGLVAGKIADKYKKPTFVWGGKLENLKGSCRSGGKYSVYSLMERTKKEFVKFGGHDNSGGFEIVFDKIHTLEKKLSKNLNKTKKIEEKIELIDAEITLDDVNMANYHDIQKLEPFGIDNQQPKFLIKNIKIFRVNYFGKNKEHLELVFKNSKNQNIKAITFYYSDKFPKEFKENQVLDLICSLELNTWNNNSELRLKIEKTKILE